MFLLNLKMFKNIFANNHVSRVAWKLVFQTFKIQDCMQVNSGITICLYSKMERIISQDSTTYIWKYLTMKNKSITVLSKQPCPHCIFLHISLFFKSCSGDQDVILLITKLKNCLIQCIPKSVNTFARRNFFETNNNNCPRSDTFFSRNVPFWSSRLSKFLLNRLEK